MKKLNLMKITILLLVVIFHAYSVYSQWYPANETLFITYSMSFFSALAYMRMPTFVAISGYIYYYLTYEKQSYNNTAEVFNKKVRRLLFPFFSTAIFWNIPMAFIFLNYNQEDVINNYILAKAPNQLWFLLMLFEVFCVFLILTRFIDFNRINMIPIGLSLLLVYYFTYILKYFGFQNYFQYFEGLKYLLFFFIGMCLKRSTCTRINNKVFASTGFICCVILGVVLDNFYNYGGIYRNITYLSRPILSVFFILSTFGLFELFSSYFDFDSSLYIRIQNSGMVLYLFHQQILYFLIDSIGKLIKCPEFIIYGSFAISCLMCSILYNVLVKFKLSRLLFGLG